jgi:hypothetical protein
MKYGEHTCQRNFDGRSATLGALCGMAAGTARC